MADLDILTEEDAHLSTSAVLVLPLATPAKNQAAPHASSGDPSRSSREGTKFQGPLVQSSMASMQSSEASTSLHEECEDFTEPCGSSEDFTFPHADNVGFTYIQESRGDAVNVHDGGRDPFEDLLDPCFQELDAHATNILQPCSSDCSSVISIVTNAASESTSRLNNAYMSVESQWTDAKHGSYLDYMETNFVKNLYGREYCALDVCGQGPFPQGSKSSSPLSSTLFEFESWQSGDWGSRSMLKPPLPTCIPLALLKSPWVRRFRHHRSPHAKHQVKMENASTSCDTDEGEEVSSPSPELHHTLRSKMGHEENFFCKNGSSGGDEVAGILKQDGLQEFAHDTVNSSFSNMKKRGFETDFQQEASIRCKHGRSLSDKYGVGSTK